MGFLLPTMSAVLRGKPIYDQVEKHQLNGELGPNWLKMMNLTCLAYPIQKMVKYPLFSSPFNGIQLRMDRDLVIQLTSKTSI